MRRDWNGFGQIELRGAQYSIVVHVIEAVAQPYNIIIMQILDLISSFSQQLRRILTLSSDQWVTVRSLEI